jgi:hypothetical protein
LGSLQGVKNALPVFFAKKDWFIYEKDRAYGIDTIFLP